MKKFLPYILTLMIIVNIFTPFSVIWKENNTLSVIKNEVRAEGDIQIVLTTESIINDKVTFNTEINWGENVINKDGIIKQVLIQKETEGEDTVRFYHTNDTNKEKSKEYARLVGAIYDENKSYKDFFTENGKIDSGKIIINGFSQSKEYKVSVLAAIYENTQNGNKLIDKKDIFITFLTKTTSDKKQNIEVNTAGDGGIMKPTSSDSFLPSCGWADIVGCTIHLLYYGLFQTTSFVFGLAGKFFDWAFAYSIIDTSYRTAFVNEGWAIVRDVCNIFFIFVLLYAAFKSIFGSHEAKSIVIKVIIIGLLINFSLLATRVMIDASNILARLFYTSETIKESNVVYGSSNNSGVNNGNTSLGEISMSETLVNKVDPQKIIMELSKSQPKIELKDSVTGDTSVGSDKNSGIGIGSWFLIILLASAINIVGLFVFLSVGLVFIARVIGLWFAMIFAPLAFFSYTVPQMQGIAMVGWKKWWSDTLGLCFVAPIFMFFMYLILMFLEKGFTGLISENDGPNWVLSVVIPFVFIMILLMTAKKLAKEYSGTVGQTITGAVTAVGAMALGGAALGAAFVGRRTVGTFMKGATTGDSAAQRFQRGESKNTWDLIKGGAAHYGTFTLGTRLQQAVGRGVNHDQHRVHEIEEGRHLLDETAGAMNHGKKYADLNQDERTAVRMRMDINDMIRNRVAVNYTDPNTGNVAPINYGNRKSWAEMTNPERQALQDEYATNQALTTRAYRRRTNTETFSEQQETHSNRKQGLGSKILQSSSSGSFDVRNLSKITAKEYESGISKMMHGITSGLAESFRSGMKNIPELNYGVGQKDFFKDLKNTLSESLKSAKIKVDVGGGGHGGGHDDHGGGHDDHGGGHH